MARGGSSGLGRIVGGLVVLCVAWFGLGHLRKATQAAPAANSVAPLVSAVAPVASSTGPAASSASGLVPAPGLSPVQRLAIPPDVSSPVTDVPVTDIAVANGSLYTIAASARDADDRRGQIVVRDLATGTERVVREVVDAWDLTALGSHLVWSERSATHHDRRIFSAKLDGGDRRELLPYAPMTGFFPAGDDLVFRHGHDVYTLSPSLELRSVLDIDFPGGVPVGDPDAPQKLLRLEAGITSAFGGDAERIYWSTIAGTVSSSKLCSIARTGGAIRVEETPPPAVAARLFGVTDSGPVFSLGPTSFVREQGRTRMIEGDGRGSHGGARVVAGDLYFLVSRLVAGMDVSQSVVIRLRRGGTKLEPLVETRAFDVNGDKLYFAAPGGVRVMPR